MKYTGRIVIVILLSLPFPLLSQTLEMAKILYKKGHYESAIGTFRENVKRRPNDASLNQWYGVCLYMTGSKEEAVPYLKKAAQKKIQEAYYYLGKIYYENYSFKAAAEQFELYREAIEKNGGDTRVAEMCIDMADRAAYMLERTETVTVIDSMVVDKAGFLRHYKLRAGLRITPTYSNPTRSLPKGRCMKTRDRTNSSIPERRKADGT